ncbi:AAA family ATPase [Permianibacter sp. IMCC34836]|uniref:AAA family ATPase n=1 Tax=Permianibacter fluminis TaxID=2738515 RepID=UPI00155743C4|nr:AAA family ATPase [Permianibacter fluminis]NQD35984.1 AAA family ATPase [Permianibacter fluminis]
MHKHALVVGKFAPLHCGHMLLLEAARAGAKRVTVLVWSNPDFPDMRAPVRAGWVQKLFPAFEVLTPLDAPANNAPDDEHRQFVKQWLQHRGLFPDVVYSSETYGPGFAQVIGCQHVSVDVGRQRVPISGSEIRKDVHAHRSMLPATVYAHFVRRVVFLGAESTGKSTLAAHMASVMNTCFVPEYGREVWQTRNGRLVLEDYVEIAERHRQLEDEAILQANRYLFVDTNALTTLFFSYYYNGGGLPRLHALADECIARYSIAFLCGDDIPFEQDGWRDNVLWRSRLQGLVRYDLDRRGISYQSTLGTIADRAAIVRKVLSGL